METRAMEWLKRMPPLTVEPDVKIRVYESSRATEACLWVAMEATQHEPGTPNYMPLKPGIVHAHLTLEQAGTLRDQLGWLIEHHYHHSLGDEGDEPGD